MKHTILLVTAAVLSFSGFAQEEQVNKKKVKIVKRLECSSKDDAFMGVTLKEVDQGEGPKVVIIDVLKDSGAEEAGLNKEDLIIKLNGEDIQDIAEIKHILKDYAPEDSIDIFVERDDEIKELTVKLGKHPENFLVKKLGGNKQVFFIGEPQPYMGVHLKTLEEQLAAYFGVKEGVLIEKVEEDSPASRAGLQAGDVITALGDISVGESSDMTDVLSEQQSGDEIILTVVRKGESINLPVTLGERKNENTCIFSGEDLINIRKLVDESGKIHIEVDTSMEKED